MQSLHKKVSWQVLVVIGILLYPLGKFLIFRYQLSMEFGYLFYYTSGILIGMALADLISMFTKAAFGEGKGKK